eukprot:Gb_02163 [translate_table: standard]
MESIKCIKVDFISNFAMYKLKGIISKDHFRKAFISPSHRQTETDYGIRLSFSEALSPSWLSFSSFRAHNLHVLYMPITWGLIGLMEPDILHMDHIIQLEMPYNPNEPK